MSPVVECGHRRLARLFICVALAAAQVASRLHAEQVYPDVEPPSLAMPGAPDEIVYNEDPLPSAAEDGPPPVEVNGEGTGISSSPKRFHYALRLTLRAVHDDNIFLTDSNRKSGFYFAVEPGITLGVGDIVARQENYLRFDYAPSVFLFTNNSEADALQHLFRIDGQYRIARLAVSLAQDIQILDGANLNATSSASPTTPAINLDAGGNTEVNIYATRVNFAYDLTGKTSLSGGVHYDAHDYADLISSQSISGNAFLNFNYSPKLVLGLGSSVGYNRVDNPNPDQTFEQVNLRLNYQVTGKLNLSATGGVEFRQFEGQARGGYTSPVYEIGATYQPFESTTVTLSGSRRTQNSAVFLAQDFAATSITAGITQRLFQRVYVGVNAGYENSNYFGTISGISAPRRDNYFFVQPAVDVTVTRFMTVGAYYLHRQNNSAIGSFGFYDNQVGLRTSLTF